jgi:hypothetical protein
LKVTNSAVGNKKKAMLSIPMDALDHVVKLVNKSVNNVGRFQVAIKRALENGTMEALASKEDFYRWNSVNETADIHVRQDVVVGEPGVANIYVTLLFILFDQQEDHFLEDPLPVVSISKYPGSWQWERSVDVQGIDDLRLLQQLLGLFYDEQWDEEQLSSSDNEDDNADMQDLVQVGGGGGAKDINQPGTSAEVDEVVMVEDPDAPAAKKGKRIVYKRVQPSSSNKHDKKQKTKKL